jgi:hypothetical protein
MFVGQFPTHSETHFVKKSQQQYFVLAMSWVCLWGQLLRKLVDGPNGPSTLFLTEKMKFGQLDLIR